MTLEKITSVKRNRIKLGITISIVLISASFFTLPIFAATNYTYNFEPSSNYTQSDTRAKLKIYTDLSGSPDSSKVIWLDPQGNPISACSGSCVISDSGYTANGGLDWREFYFYISGEQRPSGIYTAIVFEKRVVFGPVYNDVEIFRTNFNIGSLATPTPQPTSTPSPGSKTYIYLPLMSY